MSSNLGVVYPAGFQAAGISCGIKAKRALDLGIIFSETPCAAAGLFTTNKVRAAPVLASQERLGGGCAQAVVINSGNANACTGKRGMTDALTMANLTASHLRIPSRLVCVASTGIIGHHLPMPKISKGIRLAASALSRGRKASDAIARAIMTTDTRPKVVSGKVLIGRREVKLGGICKGAGMIAPRMATFLCFITTDVAISAAMLHRALTNAAGASFNMMTVDGHTSTNDTVICLANGAAGNSLIKSPGGNYARFESALKVLCLQLAEKVVRDGEGATKFVKITVNGARSDEGAGQMAREIADSPLVKTALYGRDPNWGRIISAAGYAGASFEQDKAVLFINNRRIFERGTPVKLAAGVLRSLMKPRDIEILLQCNLGKGSATIYTCDLSHEYVTVNAEYHT